jgi:hypothetical protein
MLLTRAVAPAAPTAAFFRNPRRPTADLFDFAMNASVIIRLLYEALRRGASRGSPPQD